MRFSVENSDFNRALNIASRAVSVKSPSSSMICVHFTADEGKLTLKATDTELYIITTIDADVAVPGKCIIPLKTLYDLVRTFPMEKIFFDIDEISYNVNISCAQLEVSLLAMDPYTYPVFDRVSLNSMVRMDNNDFRETIRESVFCCSFQLSVNPVINGLNIEVDENEIICTGLDGYKMSVRKQKISGGVKNESDIIVPGRIMNEVLKIVSLYDDDVCFGVTNNRFVVNLGDTQIMSTLIEGTYINYRNLLPKVINTVVKVNKNELMMALERASFMVGGVSNSLVKFIITDDRMNIKSESSIGKIDESINISKSGEDIKIAFNVKYFSEIMRNIKDERIILEFMNQGSPGLIKPIDDDRFTFMVMPVTYRD